MKRTLGEIKKMGYTLVARDVPPFSHQLWLSKNKTAYALANGFGDTEVVMTYPTSNPPIGSVAEILATLLKQEPSPMYSARPRNNDGREACILCGAPTRTIVLFTSNAQVCTKCGY